MYELKNNKRAIDSSVKIYKSLRRILKTKALADITVSDICSECGVSRSTFYRNYTNVVNVLEVMFEYYYNRYLVQERNQKDSLLFFFEYWYNHRDLITIISEQNSSITKNCMKRHEVALNNPYMLDIRCSLLTSLLSEWSKSKKETPKEMVKITKSILEEKCIDILLKKSDVITSPTFW